MRRVRKACLVLLLFRPKNTDNCADAWNAICTTKDAKVDSRRWFPDGIVLHSP
jgi:hypothetical protein